jgi:DNA helicase-2/ATP-dependent DNA helicase PcrA
MQCSTSSFSSSFLSVMLKTCISGAASVPSTLIGFAIATASNPCGGRNTASSGFGSHYGTGSTQPATGSSSFGSSYSGGNATKNAAKQTYFTANSAAKPAASASKHYEPGDIVEHKVFGRGTVLQVKPAAGDQIVEINFEKVGIKKTMANFAPLTKITEEE